MALTDPMPALSATTRLLVVAPHPDDETIATGGLIQQVLAAGGAVRIMLLTSGDNNPWPQRWLERRWRIDAAGRQRWGKRRHAEMLAALHGLGLGEDALTSIDWPDMGVTDRLMQHTAQSLATITAAISSFTPTLLAMPAIEDRHPDHGAAHVLLRLALADMADPPQLLGYLVHGDARTIASVDLPASAAQSARKLAALEAHHTQMALSSARLRRIAAGKERYVTISSIATGSARALPWRPAAWLRPWLRISMVSRQHAQSWRWRDAPLQRGDDGAWRLSGDARIGPGPCFVKLSWAGSSPWIFDHWGWCEA